MDNAIDTKVSVNTNLPEGDIDHKIEIATQTLERNISFITNCDNKTSIVLTAIGVLLTIILTNDGLIAMRDIIHNCLAQRSLCSIVYLICFAIAILILVQGMYQLGSVLIARTSVDSKNLKGRSSDNSHIFFDGIHKYVTFQTYKEEFQAMDRQELLTELIAQIYINADVATIKYNKYNSGFKQTIIGFVAFVIVLLIGLYIY